MNTKNLLALFAASVAASALASDGEMSRPQGIPIGERMTLRPYVSLSFTYDSNVDQMKHSQDGSQWIVNPGLNLDYKGENWSVQGAVWYQYHAYNNYSHQLNQSNYGEHLKAAWTNSKQDEKGWSALFTERFQQINQDDDLRSNNGRGIGRDRKEFTADGIVERRVNEYLHASALANYYLLDYDNSVHKYASLYGWKRTRAGGEIGYAPTKWTDFILHAEKSGQVLILQVDSVVIRSAKPYLATPGATVHGHYGEILYEGDTLVTFIYEKSRSDRKNVV